MSSRVSQVVPSSAPNYSISLRVRHPTLDPDMLTQNLHLEPLHSWRAGEPRRSATGAMLGGEHRESYWAAPLPGQGVGAAGFALEPFLSQQLTQLNRHRELLSRLQAEGGQISMLVEVSRIDTLTLSTGMSRKLADLNIELELQFVTE